MQFTLKYLLIIKNLEILFPSFRFLYSVRENSHKNRLQTYIYFFIIYIYKRFFIIHCIIYAINRHICEMKELRMRKL